MDSLWIVDDEGPARAAIARLAGMAPTWAGTLTEAGAGAPRDATPPEAVVLGVGPRLGDALAAANRIAGAHPDAGWVLLRRAGVDPPELSRRFAAFAPIILRWPPPAAALRRALARGPAPDDASTLLASRRQRDLLVRRFTRSFGDLDLPDPVGQGGPLLVMGEGGTGRLLLARVAHALADRPSAFLHIACETETELGELLRRIEVLEGNPATICLEHPEALPRAVQRELRGWVELGPPGMGIDPGSLQWIGLVDETEVDALDGGLERALSGREIRIPPLRERPGAAERFAVAWLADWCISHGVADRPLGADARNAIAGDSWPGNLRELEETLRRAMATGRTGALTGADLGAQSATGRDEGPATPPRPAAPEPDTAPGRFPSFARALSHELRNPMVSLRTFAQLLPERHDDPTFRDEFRYQVERDLVRIDDRLERLHAYAELRPAEARPVDVSALVEALLDERRGVITERSLLVLRELEDERPEAMGDPDCLRFAFAALLDAAFEAMADGADLYVACRHHPRGLHDRPAMRVLVRFHAQPAPAVLPGEDEQLELSLVLARQTLENLGGQLSVDSTEADERVLLVDLPAPARSASVDSPQGEEPL